MVDSPDPETVSELSFLMSITGNLTKICGDSLRELDLQLKDKAVAGLIIKYASEIDNGNLATLAKLGPPLLQALEALQMSPRSRMQSAIKKGNTDDEPTKPKSALDELRAKRLERQNGAETVHSATS